MMFPFQWVLARHCMKYLIAINGNINFTKGDRNEFNILLDVSSSSTTNIFMNLFSTFLIVVYFKVCFITGRALGYVLVS
ncbi:MAG: hypothetical protein E4H46_03835 [Desulfobacterales bacterium]|nr:MAG: hypothetical protein E4H46_03835 [Desulfobacterales bacterium]